jgi:hypothetical protein
MHGSHMHVSGIWCSRSVPNVSDLVVPGHVDYLRVPFFSSSFPHWVETGKHRRMKPVYPRDIAIAMRPAAMDCEVDAELHVRHL